MKRIIITLSVLFTLATTTTAFASEVKVSPSVMQAFKARFADAENVSWSEANGFTIAEFTLDDTKHFAYFNAAGEITVVAQPLTVKDLSKAQQTNLRKNYADYTVVDVYQLEDNEGVKYYAVVENASKKIILSTTTSKWDVVKSTNK
jgi:hypothetical protein